MATVRTDRARHVNLAWPGLAWEPARTLLAFPFDYPFAVLALLAAAPAVWTIYHERRRRRDLELALSAPLCIEPGGRVGQYRLHELLGTGGMAEVFRATSLTDPSEPPRAVKVMHEAVCRDPEFLARLQREASICKQLRHPNLVEVYGQGEEGGRSYLVLELINGWSLRELMRAPWEEARVKELLLELCRGLEAAHARGVVHRDLKPENVILTKGQVAKIADFGLARGDAYPRITRTGTSLGTPAYMPPEQARGEPGEARSDLYSLGCLAYELLAGRPPFEGE
ncbi:MAG: serine/threonine-protein kinase, partial [Candidatus Eremiobacterota bacterium]